MTLQDRRAGRTFSVRGASAREPPKVADNEPLGRCLKLGDDPVLGVNERRPGATGSSMWTRDRRTPVASASPRTCLWWVAVCVWRGLACGRRWVCGTHRGWVEVCVVVGGCAPVVWVVGLWSWLTLGDACGAGSRCMTLFVLVHRPGRRFASQRVSAWTFCNAGPVLRLVSRRRAAHEHLSVRHPAIRTTSFRGRSPSEPQREA